MSLTEVLISQGEMVVYAGYALVFLAAFIITRMLAQENESRLAQDNLADLNSRKATNFFVKVTRPIFMQYVVPMIRGKPFWESRRKAYKRKLVSSGLSSELTPDEFIAFKLSLILFFPILGGFLRAMDLADISREMILLSGVLGWFYPDLWVRSLITTRQKKVLRSLPFVIDLLALSTEAGLDFVGAIGKVVEKSNPSPLIEELSQVLKEIQVGSTRMEALREMSIRLDMQEVNSMIAVLISADQMGAPIGRVLRQQSDQIRLDRLIRAEKAGAAATQKLIVPLVVILMPAAMLIMMGPMVVGWLTGGGGGP